MLVAYKIMTPSLCRRYYHSTNRPAQRQNEGHHVHGSTWVWKDLEINCGCIWTQYTSSPEYYRSRSINDYTTARNTKPVRHVPDEISFEPCAGGWPESCHVDVQCNLRTGKTCSWWRTRRCRLECGSRSRLESSINEPATWLLFREASSIRAGARSITNSSGLGRLWAGRREIPVKHGGAVTAGGLQITGCPRRQTKRGDLLRLQLERLAVKIRS